MKKIVVVCFTVVIALSLSTAILAQEEQKVRGTVVKIDTATKSVSIKTREGTEVTVVMDDPGMLSRVKEDMIAEVKYVVKNGVNAGFKIRRLIEGCN